MKFRLLVIETDGFFRHRLEQHFTAGDVRLFCADRLIDAAKIVKRKRVDVALIDVSGLKAEGLQIVKTIRQIDPKMEMITITGADQIALSMDVMKLGVSDDFLAPVDINALIDRIRTAACRKQEAGEKKPSLFKRYQDAMAAAAFAEAGEVETARAFLENGISRKKSKKGDTNGK